MKARSPVRISKKSQGAEPRSNDTRATPHACASGESDPTLTTAVRWSTEAGTSGTSMTSEGGDGIGEGGGAGAGGGGAGLGSGDGDGAGMDGAGIGFGDANGDGDGDGATGVNGPAGSPPPHAAW